MGFQLVCGFFPTFWSQVFRSSTKSPCDLIVAAKFLAKSEVRYFNMSIRVQQQIFKLQIAIDNVFLKERIIVYAHLGRD
jgi:hypothetical protein